MSAFEWTGVACGILVVLLVFFAETSPWGRRTYVFRVGTVVFIGALLLSALFAAISVAMFFHGHRFNGVLAGITAFLCLPSRRLLKDKS